MCSSIFTFHPHSRKQFQLGLDLNGVFRRASGVSVFISMYKLTPLFHSALERTCSLRYFLDLNESLYSQVHPVLNLSRKKNTCKRNYALLWQNNIGVTVSLHGIHLKCTRPEVRDARQFFLREYQTIFLYTECLWTFFPPKK